MVLLESSIPVETGMLSSKVAVFVKKAPWKIDGIFKFRIFKWHENG